MERERPRPASLGLRPIHLQTTLTVFFHTIFPSEISFFRFFENLYRQSKALPAFHFT